MRGHALGWGRHAWLGTDVAWEGTDMEAGEGEDGAEDREDRWGWIKVDMRAGWQRKGMMTEESGKWAMNLDDLTTEIYERDGTELKRNTGGDE